VSLRNLEMFVKILFLRVHFSNSSVELKESKIFLHKTIKIYLKRFSLLISLSNHRKIVSVRLSISIHKSVI